MKAKTLFWSLRAKGRILTLVVAASLGMLAADALAATNYYDVQLKQRRLGSQIGVEVWMRSTSSDAPKLGNMSIAVKYNNTVLTPANPTTYNLGWTDSVDYNVDQSAPLPYREFNSQYNGVNGYSALAAQAGNINNEYFYQLGVKVGTGGAGIQPSVTSTSRGTFVGRLLFNITDYSALTSSTLSNITIDTSTTIGDFVIYDINGRNIESNTTLMSTPDFTVRGITLLNPNGPNESVNRNKTYSSLSVPGYPVYFERSGIIAGNTGKEYGTNYLAYAIDYSTDNGTTWLNEVIRFAETREDSNTIKNTMGATELYKGTTSELSTSNGLGTGYYVTQGDGSQLPVVTNQGYGGIVRIIWSPSENFAARSEQAKLRIWQLDTVNVSSDIDNRTKPTTNPYDISDASFVLSRLFFTQLDGSTKYFKTRDNYSNATQLTVEAWVNLNGINGAGTEPGVVAVGPGPSDPTTEGAWILYLKDGKYPAFRAREIVGGAGRGQNGGAYIATVVSPDSLTPTSDATPIDANLAHADNWHHLSATVDNNVVKLYVDGELKDMYTNNNAVNIRMATLNHPAWIGVNPNGGISTGDYLYAGIKEVRVWRKALTQDQIRGFMPGVYSPATSVSGDIKTALELYYDLQASYTDKATTTIQNGVNPIYMHISSDQSVAYDMNAVRFRPDRGHIRITSPTKGAGVSNLPHAAYDVRFAAYGLGSIASNSSQDIVLEWSKDGGSNWVIGVDSTTPGNLLDYVQIESGRAYWEPFKNATVIGASNDLQAILPIADNYSKNVTIRLRGSEANNQTAIKTVSGNFTVAPYFALQNLSSSMIAVPEGTALNLSTGVGMLEAWVRPYRLPNATEGYFPIIQKKSADSVYQYEFNLLKSGQLQFRLKGENGTVYSANSDVNSPVEFASQLTMDSAWTHVAVFYKLGTGASKVIFYIDGTPQSTDTTITNQLGSNIVPNTTATYKTYFASEPAALRNFFGAIKEVRIWKGAPAGMTYIGTEPTELTSFIRGALGVRAHELVKTPTNFQQNLAAAFEFNGQPFVSNDNAYFGNVPTIATSSTTPLYAVVESPYISQLLNNGNLKYIGVPPQIKVVEPTYKQLVPNSTTVTVRWVGFDYDRNLFHTGDKVTSTTADMEWSPNGGGDNSQYPYNFVSSKFDVASWVNSLALPSTAKYRFQGTNPPLNQFAATLNIGSANADADGDGLRTSQNPIPSALSNARLRLQGRTSINNPGPKEYTDFSLLRAESPLFTVTPGSNFTVRVLLEGYQSGKTSEMIGNLGSTYKDGGFKFKLYADNGGSLGALVATGQSTQGYSQTDPLGLPAVLRTSGSKFANVPVVFDSIADGRYWLVVLHRNHLPIMSRYPVPFSFSGGANDIASVWDISSGWDFTGWDGVEDNVISQTEAENATAPSYGTNYTARGYAKINKALSDYAATGMVFNNGLDGSVSSDVALSSMVGGDINQDGNINATDRVAVVAGIASNDLNADVTGDGYVNSDDRTIVYRNEGKVSSLKDLDSTKIYQGVMVKKAVSDKILAAYNEVLNANIIDNSSSKAKKGTTLATSGLSYKVTGETELTDTQVKLSIYVQNLGADFAFANTTFGVSFDPSVLSYNTLENATTALWSNNSYGYTKEYSAPLEGVENALPDVRTIDIDFGNYDPKVTTGVNVPNSRTLVGTLVFDIKQASDIYDFNWNKITSVHDVDGLTITKYGQFEPIEAVNMLKTATVSVPNGGEAWKSGREYQISWTVPSKATNVYVEFSSDNAETWTRINSNTVSVKDGEYSWTASKIKSSECIVRIVDATTGVEIDRSDNAFAIVPAMATITKPAATDPVYHGGIVDAINWNVENPTNVIFEFSPNGESDWQTVTSSVNSQTGQTAWDIPLVNTKTAVVSMKDATTGELLALSEYFKVLAGDVDLTSPVQNDVVKPNEARNVVWSSENINQFDLELSLDGGNTWAVVQNSVNALKGSYSWTAPNATSEHAILRALYNNDAAMEYDRTAEFQIRGTIGVNDGDNNLSFNVGEPVPNPTELSTNVEITLPIMQTLNVALYSASGEKVMDVVNGKMYMNGTHNLNINVSNLTSGAYYLRINAGGNSSVKLITVAK